MLSWLKRAETSSAKPRDEVAIRMEAIGGQGANSAGKILSEAAVTGAGYEGCHFASFGSEKRGSPVQSFVRFSPARIPVRSAFFGTAPDVIVVFHETMLRLHPSSLAGATGHTVLVVNSPGAPEELRLPTGTKVGRIYCVDAGSISRSRRCGINAAMLGAVLAAVPEVPQGAVEAALERFFAHLTSQARSRNIAGLREGRGQVRGAAFAPAQAAFPRASEPLPRLGWANAPVGGVIVHPGNTALRDHSLSRRGFAPRFDPLECIQCGYCDMLCPDYCFVWERSGENGSPVLRGIDYQFCKGCQKCVSICPSGALSLAAEKSIPKSERLRRFPGLDPEELERKWQAVDWNVHYPDEEEER